MNNKLYRPSGAAESAGFFKNFCDRCAKEKPPNNCQILAHALLDEAVPEWHYTNNKKPTCSAFQETENHFIDVDAFATQQSFKQVAITTRR